MTSNRRTIVKAALLGGLGLSQTSHARLAKMRTVRVDTIDGPVLGKKIDDVCVFRGLPYARAARFEVAQKLERRTKPYEAFENGPACPQNSQSEPNQDENCQFLSLFTPACDGRARPVLVYIHGGAYMTGAGHDPLYDGSNLCARQDVVVVSITHRLNAFGYLYLGRLERELTGRVGALRASGNVGQSDLIAALMWIKANIARFGGNPNAVLVFGQSGGGAKIATLMAQPDAKGLFHRIVTMSGQQVTASGPDNATRRTTAFLNALGLKPSVDHLETLKTVPAKEMLSALKASDPILGGGLYMGPVLDQVLLHRHPFYPDVAAQSNSIPMIIGNTLEETRYFLGNRPEYHALKWEDVPRLLPAQMRVDLDPYQVVDHYRALYPDMSPSDVFFRATTASRSWRGAIIEAEERAKAHAPTYVTQLNWRSPLDGGKWGACHTLDIALMFDNCHVKGALTGNGPEAQALAAIMSQSLAAFARTGVPQTEATGPWPRFDLNERKTLIWDQKPRIEHDPRGEERKLFARVPYVQPGT